MDNMKSQDKEIDKRTDLRIDIVNIITAPCDSVAETFDDIMKRIDKYTLSLKKRWQDEVKVEVKIDGLREEFLKLLTVDSDHIDARRRDFNQAIFDAKEGWQVYNGTDLDMVMTKFDRAVKIYLFNQLKREDKK